ncbi:MAG: flavodoxin family protein [Lentisphaeria bacterium]|nr:flavodoxin family protein [Lentisphaeria bacterium]
MKGLLINGSPRENGNTARALKEVADTLRQEGLETETVWIGRKPVRGCIACGSCREKNLGKCIFDDDIANRIAEKLPSADAIVIGAPTYYGQPAGQFLAVWQRICYSAGDSIKGKPAASIAVCRRGGSTAAFQCMNMPFEMLSSVLIGSQYWNIVFGCEEGESGQDIEGMQTLRTLGRNMAWVVKNLTRDGAVPRPEPEAWQPMNFIR